MSTAGTRRRRDRRAVAATLLIGVLVGLGGLDVAASFWTASSTAPGSGAAGLGSVDQGNTPAVSVTSNDIVVDWDPSTLANGAPVAGYTVQRTDASTGTPYAATGGCAGTVVNTVCTESNVANGLWTYAVTPRFATSWAGPQSGQSATVRSDGTPPNNALTRNATAGGSFLTGTTIWYRGAAAGSFTLTNAVTDTGGSGPASSTTGALGGTTAGWTHTPSTVTTPAGGPYVSSPFSWAAGTTGGPTVVVTGRDGTGNARAATVTMANDSTAPTGGSLSHATGAQTVGTTLPVSMSTVTETQSGLVRQLQRRTATLSGNTCGTFGGYATVSTSTAATISTSVTNGNCYQYQNVLTDNVGNAAATLPGPGVVRIRNYGTTVATTSGRLSHWRLNGAAATAATVSNGTANTAIWSGGPTFGAVGAIAGDADTAVGFDGLNDYGTVNRGLAGTNLSVELWFRSTQGLGASTDQWYDGAGLVDADTNVGANDFGVSLSAAGNVMAGTGNPDTTIRSGTGYNDGAWHHVVFTRSSTGALVLYVDGVQRATGTGGTATLTSSATMSFGRTHTSNRYFAGSLDEIATYNAVLPAATVLNHYQIGLP